MNAADKLGMIAQGMYSGDIAQGQTITTDPSSHTPLCHMNSSYFDPPLIDIWWPRFELFFMGAAAIIIVLIVLMILGKAIAVFRDAPADYKD